MNENTVIVIDDGDMFYGTVDQFKDCFFSNADEETIRDWANVNGYNIEVKENGV